MCLGGRRGRSRRVTTPFDRDVRCTRAEAARAGVSRASALSSSGLALIETASQVPEALQRGPEAQCNIRVAGFQSPSRGGAQVVVLRLEAAQPADRQEGLRGFPSQQSRHSHRSEEDRRPAAERPQLHPARHADPGRRRAAGFGRRRVGDATPGGFGAATAGFNVNGQRNQSNNFLLDGASNNDTFNTGFVLRPPPDAIQEFKILTHSYDAEYGRNSGSVVNVVTRAGSNALARRAPGSSTATTRCRRRTSSRPRPSRSRR